MLPFSRLLRKPTGLNVFPRRSLYAIPRCTAKQDHVRIAVVCGKRHKTTETGDDKTGHIGAGQNEGIFFVDSLLALVHDTIQWTRLTSMQTSFL